MQIKLDSDFQDFYDHWFALSHVPFDCIFTRRSDSGMSRPEMFNLFEQVGFSTPKYGIVRDIFDDVKATHPSGILSSDLMQVVVHLDNYTHRGENKVKCSLMEAMQSYPDCFATEFIANDAEETGFSIRYLRIGHRQFWLQYRSDDWRSNVGNVDVRVAGEDDHLPENKRRRFMPEAPLLALDFLAVDRQLVPIDLNVAPGLQRTGVENWISAKEVFNQIQAAILENAHPEEEP